MNSTVGLYLLRNYFFLSYPRPLMHRGLYIYIKISSVTLGMPNFDNFLTLTQHENMLETNAPVRNGWITGVGQVR